MNISPEITRRRKQQRYQHIREQLLALLNTTDETIARMATIAAVLHHKMNYFFWTGFYRLIEGELLVGPYQGFLACQKLQKETGVCWSALRERRTIIVPDVNRFPGHIACDSRSRSEIAVPCFDTDGKIRAVLDVDSREYNSFDSIDGQELEGIASLIFTQCVHKSNSH